MTKEPVKIYTINEYDIDPDDHMMHFTQSFVFYHSSNAKKFMKHMKRRNTNLNSTLRYEYESDLIIQDLYSTNELIEYYGEEDGS